MRSKIRFKHWLQKFSDHYGSPVAWQADQKQDFKGAYAKNERLAGLQRFDKVSGALGPESIAIDTKGLIYASFEDGRIVQFNAQGKPSRVVANTGGRPLGLRFHPEGQLLVCDASLGLLQVDTQTGAVQLLTNSADGVVFKFADDLDVSRDGSMIYFTDASSRWGYNQDHLDIIEHRGYGRLLSYNCKTAETTVLMRDLVFANGVTLDADQQSVLVTETGQYRIHRYWLMGEKAGQSEVWVDNLPGMPDNIRFNGTNCYWVAIPHARSAILDQMAAFPSMRRALMLYARYLPVPAKKFSCVLGFNANGKLIHNLQSHQKGHYYYLTQALENEGYLYCSSLKEPTIARIKLD
jgi:sugar lactone lactonase YvrE